MATHIKLRLGLALTAAAKAGALVALAAALSAGTAQAQSPMIYTPGVGGGLDSPISTNLVSKLYAVDVEGEAYVENGGMINPLSAREIYVAQGSTVYTAEESTVSLVISNGTGIFLSESTRMTVTRAAQEPFQGERSDMINEPSVSNIQLEHQHGIMGICTSRLLAGTLLEVVTDEFITRIVDGKLVYERGPEGSSVTLVGGDASVQSGQIWYEGEGRDLKVRHKIFFPADGSEPVETQLSGSELAGMEGIVTIACLARRGVYFDVLGDPVASDVITTPDEAGAPGGDGIVGVPTTPGGGGPGGGGGGAPPTTIEPPVVSPANIP